MKKIFQIFYILILSLTLLLNPKILIHATDNSGYFPEFQDWGDPVGNGVFGAQQGNETGVGDLNGDGYTDLVIGEHVYQSSMGKVFLYKGSNNGLLEGGSIVGEKANDYFGYVVTIGDLNNDEIDDLVVAAIYSPASNTGRLYIFWGRLDFFETVTSYSDADIIIDAEQAGSRFSGTDQNAIGDFNNDGWPDLATGAYSYNPGSKASAGKTYVFFGGEHAWDNNLNAGTDADFTVTGDASNYYVGESHVAGDVNNDGIDDLLISNWRNDLSYAGELVIFYGSDSLSGNKLSSEADLTISGNNPDITYEYFGGRQNYTVADIDNDGFNDLIVGLYVYRTPLTIYSQGAVYIFLGSSGYLNNGSVIDYTAATITLAHSEELDSTFFGFNLTAFDYTNDGKTDLAISAPLLGDGTDYYGGVYLYSSDTLRSLSGTVVADEVADSLIKGNGFLENTMYYRPYFGRILFHGDFNNNGLQELGVITGYAGTGRLDIYELGNKLTTIDFGSEALYNSSTPGITGSIESPVKTETINKVKPLLFTGSYQTGPLYDYDFVHTGYNPTVLNDNGTYKMWYGAYNQYNYPTGATGWRGGYATSVDGITWTKYEDNLCTTDPYGDGCVFDRNTTSGTWDDAHVIPGTVINDGGTYKMWYMGNDGSNWKGIGYATSADGITWTRNSGSLCAGLTGDGCVMGVGGVGAWDITSVQYPRVIKEDTTYKMWYTGQTGSNYRIGYATSPDGVTWTRHANNLCTGTTGNGCIVNIGADTEWDDYHVIPGNVLNDNGTYKMWYSGYNSERWQIGYMTSADGIVWTKYSQNPTLPYSSDTFSIDRGHTYLTNIIKEGTTYKMWYSANDGVSVRPAYATSTNGTTWTKYTEPETNTYTDTIINVQGRIDSGTWFDCTANDGTFNSIAEDYTCTPPSNLTDGNHTIDVRSIDEAKVCLPENFYGSKEFTVDATKPQGTITINSGDEITNSLEATLTLSASDALSGVTSMMISESSSFTGASWESYSTTKAYTLTSSDGTKTVYVKFKDAAGNESSVYSDTIILDTTDPEGPVVIESPTSNEYTNSQTITLELSGTDELTEVVLMMICENESFEGCSWETYSTTKEFILSSGDGDKILYVKYQDGAGNESAIQTVTITLDTTTTINLTKINDTDFNADLTDWEVNTKRPTFMGTGEPGSTITIYSDEVIIGTTTVDEEGNWSFTPETDLTEGDHTITFTSTDLASNTDTLTFNLNVLGTSNVQELPDTGVSIIIILFLTLITFWLAVNFRVIERLQKVVRK